MAEKGWHWHEKDLGEWLKRWLELNMDGAVLCETTSFKLRVSESYRDNGECLAHRRKGELFTTYNFDLVVKWQAFQFLDGRIVGTAKGRYRVNEFTKEGQDIVVQGEWQYKTKNNAAPIFDDAPSNDDVSEVEEHLKRTVSEKLEPLIRRLDRLRCDLEDTPPSPKAIAGPAFDAGPELRAELSTLKIVQEVKAKLRSPDFEVRLKEIRDGALLANFRCMSLTDLDVPSIVEALKGAKAATLDLSSNDITDAGIQSLMCALATGTAPSLTSLLLIRTKISPLGKRQLKGLATIRRNLHVSIDDSS